MADIYKAAGIIIKDRKVLFEKSYGKEFYIAPGGKHNPGETSESALVRELKEECSIDVDEDDLEFFDVYTADAANHPGQKVKMKVFIVKKWSGKIIPATEVESLVWMTSDNPDGFPIGSIFGGKVMPRLKQQGLID